MSDENCTDCGKPVGDYPSPEHARKRCRACDNFKRGETDCFQDRCENCPFASIGGLDARASFAKPQYITDADWPAYSGGYASIARELYGADWATCSFSWQPALTIPCDAAKAPEGSDRR